MGVMNSISLDIAEISEKVIKEIRERSLKEVSGHAADSYIYLLLEGVGAELIRASNDYKEE